LTLAVGDRRRRGLPILDLTGSNPTAAGFTYPDHLLASLADVRSLAYRPDPFGALEARLAVSDEYARQGLTVPADRIVLTASTSEAYSLLFKLLADAGDNVLVPRPSYPLFDHLTRLDLVTPVSYDLEYHGRWSIDFASLERALTDRTRAVLVVSPNNPTGSFVVREELDRLADLCADREIAIIADEVVADYELEPGAAADAGRAATTTRALSFAFGGLSKSVGLPQVKLGWIAVSGPGGTVERAMQRLELVCDTYLSVSTPAQIAAAELLQMGAAVRDQISARVRRNYGALRAAAAATPSCSALRSEGGWYAVLQAPSFEPEEELVLRLLGGGVLVHPGFFFDFHRETFLVVSLLTPEAAFDDGIARVLRHFACTPSAGPHD
jgi:aspartate/methionine/tyrosine aminotransferase